MKRLLTLFFLFNWAAIYAQKDSTAFLINNQGLTYYSALHTIENKKIKFADKFEMIKSFDNEDHMDLMINIFLKLLPEAKKQTDKTGLMYLYSHLYGLYLQSNPDQAKLYLDSASLFVQQVKDIRTLAGYYLFTGTYYFYLNNTVESHCNFLKALSYYEQMVNKEEVVASILYNLSLEYMARTDTASLKTLVDKLNLINNKKQDKTINFYTQYIKMAYYKSLYDISRNTIYCDSAVLYANNYINAADDLSLDRNMIDGYVSIVWVELSKSNTVDYNKLWGYIKKSESLALKQDSAVQSYIQCIKAEFFYKTKRYNNAGKEALRGLEYMPKKKASIERDLIYLELYKTLSLIYEAKHDFKQALKYEKLRNQTEMEINNTKQYESIKGMEKQYDLDKKEQDIQTLTNKSVFQKKIQWLYQMIILLLSVVLLLSVRWMRNRRKVFANQLEITRLKKEEADREVDRLKFHVVQAKFIPHFTGNILNSINYLISENPDSAQKYISYFSRFANKTLLSNTLSRSIREEVDYCQLYLKLEKLRFEEKLEYEVLIDPEVNTEKQVPTMVLQTFCENAIKHGLRSKLEGGKIAILIYPEKDFVTIAVEDNGIGREKAQTLNTEGTKEGLKIVQQQLDIFNKNQTKKAYIQIIDLSDEKGQPSGTRFELRIPS